MTYVFRRALARTTLAAAMAGMAACGADNEPVPTVLPASGAELVDISNNITDRANRRKDAAFYEYLCHNALGAACPEDIEAQLANHAVAGGVSRLHLVEAFVRLRAARDMGDPGAVVSDEAFVTSAYQVILGREPDASGAGDHLSFIRTTGQRQTVLRAMLQSHEFRSK